MEKKIFTRQFGGRTLQAETGLLAQQANGSTLLTYGGTTVLATAVMGQKPKENCDYLPLTVEYEEKLYAAGKIKGSRFIKREGRPQDEAIVSGRLIDRTIRPRFNQGIRQEIQVVITVLSFDKENDPDVLAVTAASLALALSDIPWDGPVAGVRIGKVDEQFIVNPTYEQRKRSSLDLVISGTQEKINMLEGQADEVPEPIMLAAAETGQKAYRELIEFQNEIIAAFQPVKTQIEIKEPDPVLKEKVNNFLQKNKLEEAIYTKEKLRRQTRLDELKKSLKQFIKENEKEQAEEKTLLAEAIFDQEIDRLVHQNIILQDKRPDGRSPKEIREISCAVGVLPRTHGSALFTRGTTQALSTVTLGSPGDKQIIDGLEQEYKKRFLHHYNFPPFSVGEIGPFRGPGRREIGHGALAEHSLQVVIPTEDQFPYTIRVVSEILSSNGSSSMASVCGSSLALMDAGVPIRAPVAGIAMGLMVAPAGAGKNPSYKILTDIQGPEDHHGDMDLKVAGTKNGVCGLQMDVKIEGIDFEILKEALEQAKEARLAILEKMQAVLAQSRSALSEFAPRIFTLQINPDKIREVIGPGGKIINEIVDQTGVKIDIEDSGLIFITADNPESAQKALTWIKNITHEVKPGEIFQGRVTRLINFGAFVEILPGQEGLIHISELAPWRVNRVDDIVKVGDSLWVKVKNIDELGRINLSLKDAQTDNQANNNHYRENSGGHNRPSNHFSRRPPRR